MAIPRFPQLFFNPARRCFRQPQLPQHRHLLPTLPSSQIPISATQHTLATRNRPHQLTRPSLGITIAQPTAQAKKRINFLIGDTFASFDNVFLRDSCQCVQCVHPSTQQKLLKTTSINTLIRPSAIKTLRDGSVKILWDPEYDVVVDNQGNSQPHESIYTAEFLLRYSSLGKCVRERYNDRRQVLWDRALMESEVTWIDYNDYMSSDQALFRAVTQLSLYGLLFIRGIPDGATDAIEGLAERIGNLKNTFYGKTWDVKSVEDSKNIAYTSLHLEQHMDLLYFESPPGLQFLHSIKNSTTGGESVFADSFRAATMIRMNTPGLFRILTTFPVTFHYQNNGHHYHFTRPTIVLDEYSHLEEKRISHINWAPPFQAPFEIDIGSNPRSQFRQFLVAAKEFAANIDNPEAKFEHRLNAGECVVFCNRRVLHSRRGFDSSSGERLLKGAYVDIDAFYSKFRTLSHRFRSDTEEQRSYT